MRKDSRRMAGVGRACCRSETKWKGAVEGSVGLGRFDSAAVVGGKVRAESSFGERLEEFELVAGKAGDLGRACLGQAALPPSRAAGEDKCH